MNYTKSRHTYSKIITLLACFDDSTIVVYDVCQQHAPQVRVGETEWYDRELEVPRLTRWLSFYPQQGGQVCSVCFQIEKGRSDPKPLKRMASILKER